MTLRIFRNSFFIGAAVMVLCAALFFGVLYGYYENQAFDELRIEAGYLSRGLAAYGEGYLVSAEPSARVTLIAADGTVTYDSAADAAKMENHRSREEIREAAADGVGKSTHVSGTLFARNLYYAVRLTDGSFLRVAATQQTVGDMIRSILSPVLGLLIALLILSGLLASRLAKQITKPINALDLDDPAGHSPYRELTPLTNRLREQNRTIRAQMDELSRRQREFAAITENMSEGFLLLDRKGYILSSNPSGMCAIAPEGETLRAVSRTLCRGEVCSAVESALAGKRSEQIIAAGDHTTQLIASPVVANGQVTGAAVLLVDVTDREQRELLRQEFSANVSHELKTPLTSISGFAELMKEGLVPADKVPEFARDIYKESSRLITLVDDIIKVSKLDEDAAAFERETVDLYELSADTIESLRPVAEKRQITMTLAGESQKITGVWQILGEMVYNLCDNAIKYNRDGGSVTVTVDRAHGCARLRVADTGIGIPYDQQGRIFERFYRVDKSHSKEIGGTGLGLSIVKHGAQYHGARIEVESIPESGTTFTVTFAKED